MSSFSNPRSATETDKPDVIALWQACGLTRPWNDPGADFDLAFRSDHSDILVIDHEGAIIATAMVGEDGHRGWVYYLGVHPDHQRAGLASTLMTACENWARDRGLPKLQLMVRTGNEQGEAFYRDLGYEFQETAVYGRWLNHNKDI